MLNRDPNAGKAGTPSASAGVKTLLSGIGFFDAKDADRLRLLSSLEQFAQATGNAPLSAALGAYAPQAHPFVPPPLWLRGFHDRFASSELPEGVSPEDAARVGRLLWQGQTDEWRRARVPGSAETGIRDAIGYIGSLRRLSC